MLYYPHVPALSWLINSFFDADNVDDVPDYRLPTTFDDSADREYHGVDLLEGAWPQTFRNVCLNRAISNVYYSFSEKDENFFFFKISCSMLRTSDDKFCTICIRIGIPAFNNDSTATYIFGL